jgi:hypothetical protein
MGFYVERVLPRIINVACGTKTAEPHRRRVCEGLAGAVVEIGLTTAGFTIEELDVFYEKGAPKFLAADSLGIAVSP